MTLIERIVDLDGTITEKPYTKEQIEQNNKTILELETQDQAQALKATAKAELLSKLGITEDEAKLLLS